MIVATQWVRVIEAMLGEILAWCLWLAILAASVYYMYYMQENDNDKIPNLIIDTDIGDDFDDTLAVYAALKLHLEGKIKILAFITSGKGNHKERARLIECLKQAAVYRRSEKEKKRTLSIPVYLGVALGTSASNYMNPYCCNQPFYDNTWKSVHVAKEEIHSKIAAAKTTVIFLGIGPLDNLQYLDLDPIRVKLVLMGGSLETNFDGEPNNGDFAEYNVRQNVDGFRQALESFDVTLVPLDLAAKDTRIDRWEEHLLRLPWQIVSMYEEWYRALQGKNKNHPILKGTMLEDEQPLYPGDLSNIQFDSAALMTVVYPEKTEFAELHIRITDDGVTKVVFAAPPNAKVALGFAGYSGGIRDEILNIIY